MSELGEFLELAHTSVRRWRTIRASGWEWRHLGRSRRAWERLIARERSRSVAVMGGSVGQPEPREVRESWRLWLAQPDKVRTEFMVGADSVTAVIVGDTWWSWSPSGVVTTNRGDPHSSHGKGPAEALIDPSSILPAVELVVARRMTFIDRPVLEVLATPTPGDDSDEERSDRRFATHGLGGGADEYALLVDAEHGVLLRSEARIEGLPFQILEMETVAFDEELGEAVFAPPADAAIEPAWRPRAVTPTELAQAVRFIVLVPERPPFGIDDVEVLPPRPRHEVPEQVHISYASNRSGEEDRQFWLVESAEPLPERRTVDWHESDAMRFGTDRDSDPPLRIVRLERLGTHVEVRSHYLEMRELLGLAHSLVPLRNGPPPLTASPS